MRKVLREFLSEKAVPKLSMARLLAFLWGLAAIAALFFAEPLHAAEAFAASLTALGLRKGN